MKNVLVLTKYSRAGASSRLRSYQYVDYFKKEHYPCDFEIKPFLNDQYLENLYSKKKNTLASLIRVYLNTFLFLIKNRNRYDLVFIEKEIFPYFPAWVELIFLKNKKFVLDYDDAIFHNYDRHKNFLIRLFLGKKINQLMKKANLITVGNEYLKQRAVVAKADNIEIIPTVVDLDKYSMRPDNLENNLIPVIGWIGTSVTQKYLKMIESSLAQVFSIKKFKFLAIGADLNLQLHGFDYEILPWSEKTEVEFLNRIDIGVMPLLDQPFEKGKCGYKLIQYMALGKPVIASPIGVNIEIIQHKKNGFLVLSSQEWIEAFLFLLNNPANMNLMGMESRKIVESRFSLQKYAPILFKLFNNLMV